MIAIIGFSLIAILLAVIVFKLVETWKLFRQIDDLEEELLSKRK